MEPGETGCELTCDCGTVWIAGSRNGLTAGFRNSRVAMGKDPFLGLEVRLLAQSQGFEFPATA
ncbi:MAG TPA: hypothetical protein DEA96_13030 [Leptospiraceae bacterium]|nr:hypothetical protein [Spirochaetaceae bacterium]HBS05886.1 hypothetical protein [Leptospiraceae bacterium]